ncbi:MAG: PD-(D/E)XK nuclease superfamily protein [Kofleriaceae bacterium]
MGMTGNQYRDLIAGYIYRSYASFGLNVYTEISLGKTIIGKDRKIDVFVVRSSDQRAIALECKYQDSQGTTDEKIPYALEDLAALWLPGCLVYAGEGWSRGILHTLEASRLAARCLPDPNAMLHSPETRELDHVLAATFGLWELVLPPSRRFVPPP